MRMHLRFLLRFGLARLHQLLDSVSRGRLFGVLLGYCLQQLHQRLFTCWWQLLLSDRSLR